MSTDPDSQQFLDSVMVIERETVPVEFYGDPKIQTENTSTVLEAEERVFVEVPAHVRAQLNWVATDEVVWDVVDQETVLLSKRRLRP